MAKEQGGPQISFQCLLYPVTDYAFETKSYNDFAEGPWLTKKAMQWFWKAYVPEESMASDIHVSPLRASTEQLKGLPPALVITDENDVLRDEGEAYAHKLMQTGVEVSSVRINGTHHDFMMLNGLAQTTPTKTAFLLACKMLKRVLHKDCKHHEHKQCGHGHHGEGHGNCHIHGHKEKTEA